jgi:hypothetical protein
LASRWPKIIYNDARGDAGLTMIAVGAVGEMSTPSKPYLDQFAVDFRLYELGWSCYLRAGFMPIKIATSIGCCGIKL